MTGPHPSRPVADPAARTAATTNETDAIVEAEALGVRFRTRHGEVTALADVTLALRPGDIHVVIGESGSGKSVLASTLLGLLPRNVEVNGRMLLDGQHVRHLDDRSLRRLRARTVGFVPQSPATALNPVRRLGPQLLEALRPAGLGGSTARARLGAALRQLGLDLDDLFGRYPHHLSVGMQQRTLIALALARRPRLVIADEPTASLDTDLADETATQLLHLAEAGAALLVITHDLRLAETLGGRLALLYAGRVVEQRPTAAFFDAPAHPYGQALLAARPEAGGVPIPGAAPSMIAPPPGCAFVARCTDAREDCGHQVPPAHPVRDGDVRCVLHAPR